MKLKKILAIAAVSAMAVSTFAMSASAAKTTKVQAIEDGQAFVGIASGDWSVQMWGKTGDPEGLDYSKIQSLPTITGNGTYTATLDISGGITDGNGTEVTEAVGISVLGLNVWGLEETAGLNITSVKFDGKDMPITGVSFTNDEDEGKRTNVFNEWGAFKADTDITKDADKASAALIKKDDIAEWSKIEITFDVYGMSKDAGATDTDTDTDKEPEVPVTGNAGVAGLVVVAALATAGVLVSKKTK